jgi:hypothetical protein
VVHARWDHPGREHYSHKPHGVLHGVFSLKPSKSAAVRRLLSDGA